MGMYSEKFQAYRTGKTNIYLLFKLRIIGFKERTRNLKVKLTAPSWPHPTSA